MVKLPRGITIVDARLQVEAVLQSRGFRRSRTSSRFLVVIAAAALGSELTALDERVIAHDVFLRPYEFDPKLDSIVRVEARRLRKKLDEYAAGPGKNAPLVIRLVTGAYELEFARNPAAVHHRAPHHLHETTPNSDAYALYLQTRRFGLRLSGRDLRRILPLATQLASDHPGYALGQVAEAEALLFTAMTGIIRPLDVFPRIAEALRRALAIDPQLAPAHSTSAFLCVYEERDWPKALGMADHAVELNPTNGYCHTVRAICLSLCNRHLEAMDEHHRAVELEPLFAPAYTMAGIGDLLARRFDQAEHSHRTALSLDPTLELSRLWLGLGYLAQGKYGAAVSEALACQQAATRPLTLGFQGACLAATGKIAEAKSVLKHLRKAQAGHFVDPMAHGLVHLFLPKGHAAAVEALELGLEEHSAFATIFPISPLFDRIADDPRAVAIFVKLYTTPKTGAATSGKPRGRRRS